MTSNDIYKLMLSNAKSTEYLPAYIALCFNEEDVPEEKHHILPKAMFPEFANLRECQFNQANLSARNHLLAHWYLYKIFKNKECTYAFRMMVAMKRGFDQLTEAEVKTIACDYAVAKREAIDAIRQYMKSVTPITNGKVNQYLDRNSPLPEGFVFGKLSNHHRRSADSLRSTESPLKGVQSKKLGRSYYITPTGEQVFCFPEEVLPTYVKTQQRSFISKWLPSNCFSLPKTKWSHKQTGRVQRFPSCLDMSGEYTIGVTNRIGLPSKVAGSFWVHDSEGNTKLVHTLEAGWVKGRVRTRKARKLKSGVAGLPAEGFKFIPAQDIDGNYIGKVASYDPRWGISIVPLSFKLTKTAYVKHATTGEVVGEVSRLDPRVMNGEYVITSRPRNVNRGRRVVVNGVIYNSLKAANLAFKTDSMRNFITGGERAKQNMLKLRITECYFL